LVCTLAQLGDRHLYHALAVCAASSAGALPDCRTRFASALVWFARAATGCAQNVGTAQHLLLGELARSNGQVRT